MDKPDEYGACGKYGTSSYGMKKIAQFIDTIEDRPCTAVYIEKKQ